MKKYLILALLVASAVTVTAQTAAEKQITRSAVHPRYRLWPSPDGGTTVRRNPPSFLWPAEGDAESTTYRVRLSRSADFPDSATVYSEPQLWAEYSVHKPLEEGTWYWQWSRTPQGGAEEWSKTCSFVIGSDSRRFVTPTAAELLSIVKSKPHQRLYVERADLPRFRAEKAQLPDARRIIGSADKVLAMELPREEPLRLRDTTGRNDFEKAVLMRYMYQNFGDDKVREPIENLCTAYMLTGDESYARAAVRHALNAAAMSADGWATREDFNRASIMLALGTAYDVCYDFFSPAERVAVLAAVKVRGDYFFKSYCKDFECHSMDNHVWQHTMRRMMFASVAVAGDLPEADRWLEYCYETWCCRFPILGGDDGGWHDGSSYFQVNFETFLYVPFVLGKLTGVDFFDLPWYRNLPSFLIYSYPKNSYSTGFGDSFEKMTNPSKMYMGFADAIARETLSPAARWYADKLIGDNPDNLLKADKFALYRILADRPSDCVGAARPKDNTSAFFPDAGFSLMHTAPANTKKDFMATFISVPFGATGHAHAAHNGFTLSYGGKKLFGGTGYYTNFNDRHTLTFYRTRGHNTVLADGMAQVIGENGYGWLARFADTPEFTYTLGDATHAYGDMTSAFWLDRMQKSEVEYDIRNGFGNPHIMRFRRHFIYLRPNIVVIYDELAAASAVRWTWLLHSSNRMESAGAPTSLVTSNTAASARFDLYSGSALSAELTDKFFAAPVNWKERPDENGQPMTYADEWHSEISTTDRCRGARFVAIFQVSPDGTPVAAAPRYNARRGKWKVGDWTIKAQLNPDKAPRIIVSDLRGNKIAYNTSDSETKGGTVIVSTEKGRTELTDTIPSSIE